VSKLRELIDKANGLWAPQERPFASSAPVIGPVIVAMRRVLNWMSAKWYVRPILEQQIAFNSAIVQIINELSSSIDSQEQELTQIRDRLAAVLSRLEQEHERTSNIESSLLNQVREAEDLTILNDRVTVSLTRDLAGLRRCLGRLSETAPGEPSPVVEGLAGLENALDTSKEVAEKDADRLL